MKKHLLLVGSLLAFVGGQAFAAVSKEEANRLGTSLTPMGANPAPNAEGTIPKWTGEVLGAPKSVKYEGTGTHYPNPYPNEKPLFEITGKNYKDYEKNLTDGQIALFKKYPDTFRMPIYPSKRDVRYSDKVHENTKLNATNATLTEDGNGTGDVFYGVPFPIPKNAAEVLWNHMASPMIGFTKGTLDGAAVFNNGDVVMRQGIEERYILYYSDELTREKFNTMDIGAMVMIQTMLPQKNKGEVILVHELKEVSKESRNAWQYLPGVRRVRRAPNIAYDFPDGPGGLRTVDDALLFNGANNRYTWKLEGQREIYIPYNNYDLDSVSHTYKDILTPNHINPNFMRYELHRVNVLVAVLAPGMRHVYAKRRLYTDEDTWAAVLSDNFDGQGSLWRTNMRTMLNMYDLPGMSARVELYHDLQKGAYLTNYMVNEQSGPPKRYSSKDWGEDYFTPANARKLGN
ncbi:MAG TPA: DUF1329 domain-containing protein [Pseudomonadales bacterium]|nr:DUF1329 domain-containing protein [Pseudomonadales bacterium]